LLKVGNLIIFVTSTMQPDYPHKQFNDKRTAYVLLLLALAEDA
jgi:hypothetical protein